MLFNTIEFAFFFTVIFILYWSVFYKNLKIQNFFLLFGSIFFYGCWDWRFLFLLIFTIGIDFYVGYQIYSYKDTIFKRKVWLYISIILNLSFLGFFKYYNFFIENFTRLFSSLGFKVNDYSLNILLPIGISFYTFHGLSYVIDIYNNKTIPEKNFVNYALFVSYFPLLVAGPIERAGHLLPQIKKSRSFNYTSVINGLRQILWGLVKKVVIADSCAEYVNVIFNNPSGFSGSTLFVGAILFSFQIYGDFSGYTDIAIGVSRMLGIELLQNFSYPYFSRDIAEFWRRWHISLSGWFRDYVYIPLGGSRGSIWQQMRNILLIFLLAGFWHGANWTFIIYGLINFLYFVPLLLFKRNRKNVGIVGENRILPSFEDAIKIVITFILVSLARIFFRSTNVSNALYFFKILFSKSFFVMPEIFPKTLIGLLIFFIIIEWSGRNESYGIEKFKITWKRPFRLGFYYVLVWLVLYYSGRDFQFIYFQF